MVCVFDHSLKQAMSPSASFPQVGKADVQDGKAPLEAEGRTTSWPGFKHFLHYGFQLFFDLQILFQVLIMETFKEENERNV